MRNEFDFSNFNIQYLMKARDLSIKDHHLVAAFLGISPEFTRTLAEISPHELTQIVQIKLPLVIPRQDSWWWQRLLIAIRDGHQGEIEHILEHACVLAGHPDERGPV